MRSTRGFVHQRWYGPIVGLIAAALAVAVAAGCSTGTHPSADPTGESPSPSVGPADDWARQALAGMSLEEKVGQLFVTEIYGSAADQANSDDTARNQAAYGVDTGAQFVRKYHPGGVVYFGWSNNISDPAGIAGLSNGLQRAALDSGPGIPLLIATDQEMGQITRIGPPFTAMPGNMALGADGNPDDVCAAATVTGRELRALGINQDYAPVADVNVNPANPVIGTRSFGSDPDDVATLTAKEVSCLKATGVAATVKHFPGHGDTDVDSHTGLPTIDHDRGTWADVDQPPFAAAIRAGVNSVMTGHLLVPALDSSNDPATLSRSIVTDTLRGDMGFDGVIITDSLGMAGVREKYGDERVPVLALKAGVDQLLTPPDESFDTEYRAVLDAVHGGELSTERIDESVLRILRMKYDLGLSEDPMVDPGAAEAALGTPDHRRTADRIADHTVTLVTDDDGLLPLTPGTGEDVLVTGSPDEAADRLADALAGYGVDAGRYGSPADYDLTVVLTHNAADDRDQLRAAAELVDSGAPVIVVAVGGPYDIGYLPGAGTGLVTYGDDPVSLRALARVLFGEVAPTGRLPVDVPRDGAGDVLYRAGTGLSYAG